MLPWPRVLFSYVLFSLCSHDVCFVFYFCSNSVLLSLITLSTADEPTKTVECVLLIKKNLLSSFPREFGESTSKVPNGIGFYYNHLGLHLIKENQQIERLCVVIVCVRIERYVFLYLPYYVY